MLVAAGVVDAGVAVKDCKVQAAAVVLKDLKGQAGPACTVQAPAVFIDPAGGVLYPVGCARFQEPLDKALVLIRIAIVRTA